MTRREFLCWLDDWSEERVFDWLMLFVSGELTGVDASSSAPS